MSIKRDAVAAGPELAESLLRRPLPTEGYGRWIPYSRPVAILLSVFIAYHAVTVVLHDLPTIGAARALHAALDRPLGIRPYMAVNGNPRGWGLFAPDANQANYFTKVLLEDSTGHTRDLQLDVYGRRAYPYLVYDRLGNLNRRVAQGDPGLRPYYAAWVCRDWERSHGGEPAHAVVLVRRWTRIPSPEAAWATGGYHPMGLFPNEDEEVRFDCASTPGARLPNDLRRRYGLRPRADAGGPRTVPRTASDAVGAAGEMPRDDH